MGYYEPRWSAEEQTMIDVIKLSGGNVGADINKEYTFIHLYTPDNSQPLLFRADTEYEAIRKAFKFWSDGKGSKYA
jgi:hypothetical protein